MEVGRLYLDIIIVVGRVDIVLVLNDVFFQQESTNCSCRGRFTVAVVDMNA